MAQKTNLMRIDRVGYALGGLALIVWALRRPGVLRSGAAGVGGWLLYQAYTGSNPLFRSLGIQVNRKPHAALAHETIVVEDAVTIARPRAEVFEYLRSAANLPQVLESEIHVAHMEADQVVAWRGTRDGRLTHFGSIELRDAPGRRATYVGARLEYVPMGGSFGAAISCMTRHSPQRALADALRRARSVLEGEIPSLDRN
jgi:uncharacterized membrane protein